MFTTALLIFLKTVKIITITNSGWIAKWLSHRNQIIIDIQLKVFIFMNTEI